MYLNELIAKLDILETRGEGNPQITGVHYNSRTVTEGGLFVAIEGYQTDGHKYIANAVENGAKAVICTRFSDDVDVIQIKVANSRIAEAVVCAEFFGNPAKDLKLIGVTGTNGKTTVTYLVKHILDVCGYHTGLIGTNQNMVGDEVIQTGRTTPDAFELQKILRKMADEKVTHVIMEVSSHALYLNRVYGLCYEVGAFTNLTQDHLDFHGTMENYAKAKEMLFDITKKAVINSDDDYGIKMAQNCPCECKTYGIKNADFTAEDIQLGDNHVEFLLGDTRIKLEIPGEFSVYNALCAFAICSSLGIEKESIVSGLATAKGVKGRAEVVNIGRRNYTVMIDYAHTPDGIENILTTARGFAKGRVVIVFGCGGDRDNSKRAIMGSVAGRLADFCVVTSDNPRTEDPMRIISMVEEGVKKTTDNYVVIESRFDAIRYALENAKDGDVIILAGKGHETYQILNSGTIHFDEREVVREILGLEE